MEGFRKAILYSLKPHELGFCGPLHKTESISKLRKYVQGEKYSTPEIKSLLDQFLGAASYYQLIAQANNIEDIYNLKVVKAYWLGNELLNQVTVKNLKKMILTNFVGSQLLTKSQAQKIIESVPGQVKCHHSFHVFFIGSVTGQVTITDNSKEKCKVSWGKVLKIYPPAGQAEIKSKNLFPREIETKINIDWDQSLLPNIKIGNTITHHWGRIAETINRHDLGNLIKYTMVNYLALKSKHG